jgi:hypothetical protein
MLMPQQDVSKLEQMVSNAPDFASALDIIQKYLWDISAQYGPEAAIQINEAVRIQCLGEVFRTAVWGILCLLCLLVIIRIYFHCVDLKNKNPECDLDSWYTVTLFMCIGTAFTFIGTVVNFSIWSLYGLVNPQTALVGKILHKFIT